MRQIIANSVEMVAYHPSGDKAVWDKAYEKYLKICENK
jgi:rhamnulokinase